MELNTEQTQLLASMLCDYAHTDMCLAPSELDIVIDVALEAKFPQNAIESLARMRANATALVDDEFDHWAELRSTS